MSKELISNKKFQILIYFIFLVLAISFWDTIVIYPIKVFVVLLHETAHGLVAALTGGEIVKIEVDANIGGRCYTAGGSMFFIASAGYVGSIILGGMILLFASKPRVVKYFGYFISIFIIIITIFYIRNTFGFIFGIAFGLLLLIITRFSREIILEYLLKFIGITSCFYVIIDIKEDLLTSEFRGSDADMIASLTGLPAIFWAIFWILLSIISFYFFVRKSLK
jgi:hypothetical protein